MSNSFLLNMICHDAWCSWVFFLYLKRNDWMDKIDDFEPYHTYRKLALNLPRRSKSNSGSKFHLKGFLLMKTSRMSYVSIIFWNEFHLQIHGIVSSCYTCPRDIIWNSTWIFDLRKFNDPYYRWLMKKAIFKSMFIE